ncbi:GCN5-related N-acetyltransferase [alpha proteobacterium U9-1i]|nr:GCN5-related N-acetyltransferase [alpha proteobacterium U9-1i]
MSGQPNVRRARENERGAVSQVLTDAFVNEDGLNYWLRQGAAKDRVRRVFFNAAVRDLIHKERQLWVAEADGGHAGAAIWLKPDDRAFDFSPLQELLIGPLFFSVAGFEGMRRGNELGRMLASKHPREPHAHLVFLGVAPAFQGRGVGSAILKETLAPLDANGVTAYLECTTARNAALYARHGFEVTGEFDLPGLHMWTMTRPPR